MSQIQPVYLFSLPRSGSTLLQRMLGSHSRISTQPEPWILLPALYAVRRSGAYAEYGHDTAVTAVEDFCDWTGGGAHVYLDEVRRMTVRLYQKASTPGSVYFLDKTPRYNLVANEVLDLFPNAPCLVLWRNPLAVLASILDSWVGGRWMPYLHKVDLFEGLARLLEAYERRPDRFVTVRYEDVVTNPGTELRRLVDALGLPWEPHVVELSDSAHPHARLGDRTGVRRYDRVSRGSLSGWKETLGSPVRKQWSRRYLRWLGQRRLALMGYDLDNLLEELDGAPSRLSGVTPDLALTLKGMAWSVAEPSIMKQKLSRLPHWHRLYSHS